MEINTDAVILLTSSEDDEAANDDKEKRIAEHSDIHGFEYLKDIIEARASMRRKKRKKKNKKKCNQNAAFQSQDQVRVDSATEEQQSGQAKAMEIKEVTETESVFPPGNAVSQEITGEMQADVSEAVKTTIVPETKSDSISRQNSRQKIFEQLVHEITIPTLQVTLSPSRKEEIKSLKEIVSSPILEVSPSPLHEKASTIQTTTPIIDASEPLAEAGQPQTMTSNQQASKRRRLTFPKIRPLPVAQTPPNALPSNTTESSISAQKFSNMQMLSKNLLAELSSRAKILNSPLNNECTVSVVLGSDILQQQRKVMATFLNMSLEDIYHAEAFDNVERTALGLIQLTSNPLERSNLEDVISLLAQFKEDVPNAVSLAEAARAQRTSLPEKTKILDTKLDQYQEQLGSLEAEFSKLESAAAEIDAQIQLLITKKEELLLQRNSVALNLEKTNQEASRALEEWRSLEKEIKEADDNWVRADQMLVQYNGDWKHFGKNFSL
ncbi:uncharacterized protein LOC110620088 isoform X2 [Manihot esculenta]|uniref:Uncharacterized protein n=1 Tax=Manihot esculenta TaxID=3983 RepID=A0A2C9VEH2_MANES|nr:uncharacterized protein LOC110620088 isoform X2 [Manihot esculenta]OAY43059.1 hypothetical protein MANES_08G038700v8 [Manihot esculenta]